VSNESIQIAHTSTDSGNLPERVEKQAPDTSDAQIWIEFLHGSDQALGTIYRLYVSKLYSYGRQFTKNESLVLDVVQDVFFALIKNREKLGVAASVKFYLFASFRRCLVRQLRKAKLFVLPESLSESDFFKISIDTSYFSVNSRLDDEQKKLIEASCNKLPAKQREAIMLHFFEDLSYKEVAEIMQLSHIKSARNIIYKALDSLSTLLSHRKKELS
jgi:RNA polymerase sigma factor (sigma-70 family)